MRAGSAPATIGLAVVIAAASLFLFLWGNEYWAAFAGGFIPARFSGVPLVLPDDALPAWLTPLSATLIHANFIHLGFNLVMLLFTGQMTERALGVRGVLILYGIGAYVAVLAHWLLDPGSVVPLIGASGAISALMGAYSLLYGKPRTEGFGPFSARAIHALWLLVAWTVINVLVGMLSAGTDMPIAAAAHVGGFLAGLALARPLLAWRWRAA